MIGGEQKLNILKESKGLIFPVIWNEPFGLAITESLYCGAPVFGTPYGSLPELITKETGFLTTGKEAMIAHIIEDYNYSPKICHEYACDLFNSQLMARAYLTKYEMVLAGNYLNLE
ncbi:MAG: glycosyltransferase [Bacteroidales bacterium]